MAYTKIKDVPYWELCNQLPVATSALSVFATDEHGTDPFIYYLVGSTFWGFSSIGDAFTQLATPPIAPVTVLSLRYTRRRGHHTRVISATSTSVTVGGLRGPILSGETLRILSGVGAGQEKVLTWVSDNIHDSGVITGTTAANIADSTKKWKINEHAGRAVHIHYGTNASQVKHILYNDATTLYIADANLMPHNPWGNQIFSAQVPYALPVTTAGAQTHYQICSQTFSCSAWGTIPDATSFATFLTGGMYLFSSAAAAPFFTLQYYDRIADQWINKSCPQSIILAAFGTDSSIERTAKVGTALDSGTATSGTNKTLVNSGKTMIVDRYRNHRVLITGGTCAGQQRRVVCNTGTGFIFARAFDGVIDATSTYEVWPDFDRMYVGGNASSAMYAYSPENDYWMQGQAFDDGVAATISCTMAGWTSLGVTSGARIALGVRAINPVPTAAGSAYTVGDVLTCSVGGTGCRVIVTSINVTGGVTGIELMAAGTVTGFTVAAGKATTGGTGTACTIEVTAVGATCLVTLPTAHWFRTGQAATFAGCSESAYNALHTILCVGSATAFDISVTATANMAASLTQGTTTITDVAKTWTVNEHAGRLIQLNVFGLTPTSQIRWIVSNTANTLTVATITAAVNGTSKYVIYDSKIFGVAELRRDKTKKGYGHASGGSTVTLIDSSKNWAVGQWVGYKMKIEGGTGYGSGIIAITANTETTLTYATQTFTPESTTHYEIHETWGLLTAASTTVLTETGTKNWVVNQFGGKRVRLTSGTSLGQESVINTNTNNALTLPTAITLPDTTTTYAILEIQARGAGLEILFAWGSTNNKGKYLFCPRGGNYNTFDWYNITTERYDEINMFMSPQQALFTTGTMYAYDGNDYIYIHVQGTIANIIMRYNIASNKVDNAFQLAGLHSTAIIGNRMEIITDSLNNDYLYIAQNTGSLLWRAALYNL